MYDTVNFRLPSTQISNFDVERTVQYLNRVEIRQKEGQEPYCIGYIGNNYRVTLSNNSLTLKGSLHKYFKGYSLVPFELFEVKEAIQMLSDELHLDIKEAIVTRLDFGRCYFDMQMPINEYLKLLYPFGHYKKHQKHDSVYFELKTGIRSLVFYDKIAEMKANVNARPNIPENYLHSNVLKYENRFMKELGRQLKGKGEKVLVSDLTDPIFFQKLIDWHEKEYKKLDKSNILTF